MSFSVVILAAGMGTRMSSKKPKSLQVLAGSSMLKHILSEADKLNPDKIIVVHSPNDAGLIEKETKTFNKAVLAEQKEALGTGHAVKVAKRYIKDKYDVLVLLGDVPLIKARSLKKLIKGLKKSDLMVLTAEVDKPSGYGRIKRGENGAVQAIIEESECNKTEKKIKEINSGIIAFSKNNINKLLEDLDARNNKGEYYLTDTIINAYKNKLTIETIITNSKEVLGVNNKKDLAEAERLKREEAANNLMEQGVTLCDPTRIDVRGTLKCGKDVFIDANTVFEGNVELSSGVHIEPFVLISDSTIGKDTRVLSHTNIDKSTIGNNCSIGPHARLRPGSKLKKNSRVGNFVEIKESTIGEESKVNHLSYVGDTSIGNQSNIGAGTITCNYDGAQKHKTKIGNNVFIGSGVELVAPITVEDGATVAAGSTLSKSVSKDKLAIERSKQKTIDGWQRPTKNKGK